jgi:hypothetical protein
MANVIDKIIKKVNQAEDVIDTIKGIGSLFEDKDLTRDPVAQTENRGEVNIDAIQLQAANTTKKLDERRKKVAKEAQVKYGPVMARVKNPPKGRTLFLTYPLENAYETPSFLRFNSNHKSRGAIAGDATSERSDIDYPTMDNFDVDIALYLPDNFQNSQTVSYKQEKMMGAAYKAFGDEAIEDVTYGMYKSFTEGTLRDFDKLRNKRMGIAINPLEEKLFDTVQFRNHTFDFEFYPESEQEAREVNRIIYWFKMGMLPNFGTAQRSSIFNTPNTWDISVNGLSENVLEGFEESVLTGVTVNYGGGQKFAIFNQGTPVKTTLNLQFSETKIITQDNYHKKVASPSMKALAESDTKEVRDSDRRVDQPERITRPGTRGGLSGNLPFGAG